MTEEASTIINFSSVFLGVFCECQYVMALFGLFLWCYAPLLCCEAIYTSNTSIRPTLLIARESSQTSCTSPYNQQ